MARPHVVAHVAIALDGATTGFAPAVGRFYELAATWAEDVTLAGADTILAQEPALRAAPRRQAPVGAPLLAVVDSRARVREWEALGSVGHWSGVLALRAAATPPRPHHAVPELVAGAECVDLAEALTALGEHHGARVVRVDSGGGLIGALVRRGLLDELSLLVHPLLAGPGQQSWHGGAQASAAAFELIAAEALERDLVWLRYRVG
ncbi:dihydrofolate reductase family protein [Pseudonocardia sp. DSM 110487]|uniref:dihydrofolate reductase family protein n=1 Tax=Pseudonocardia sp. DSM 110487 TaxID=2865833 RepID=UPI001C6A2F68|nr:dihydrofolate reductase family protein [Pseudonocardia sp. DSM 110487]QYN34374.1 dihydrofolate reductase family protein [Pseudonocardia sp. DSM 110487]